MSDNDDQAGQQDQQDQPEQQKPEQDQPEPEPEPEPEQGGHEVVTEGDVDLPVPPLEPPEPFLESVDAPEEQLPETVMPFTGDEEGSNGK